MRETRSRKPPNGVKVEPTSPAKVQSAPSTKRGLTKTGSKRKTPGDEIKQEPNGAQTPPPANSSAKRTKRSGKVKPKLEDATGGDAQHQTGLKEAPSPASSATSLPGKAKQKKSFGFKLGESPYPSFKYPTPQDCRNVNDLLAAVHGAVAAPKVVPPPNLKVTGCGEVPSVLDALIRTRLSAATNRDNSSNAFKGLVKRFGIIEEGVGKGSVDWDAVRRAPVKDIFQAIKIGGLADVKSRDIHQILNIVYEENQAGEGGYVPDPTGKNVLSLDHLHKWETSDVFDKLVQYPGIGPKTASCVLLFCLQRPSFAVDTHVFRQVTWLGWMPSASAIRRMRKEAQAKGEQPPPSPSPVMAFAHLDAMVPDELKYSLHYFFIEHGRRCPSCAAKKNSSLQSEWGDKKCPLAALKSGKGVAQAIKEADKMEADIKTEE